MTVWRKTTFYRPVTRIVPDRGIPVTSYERTETWLSVNYAIEEVKTYDTRGKEVERKKLPGLLKGETLVLVSATGQPVDPLYLRLVKEGTLVIVLPVPIVPPPPAPPPLAPPVTESPARR